MMLTTHLFKYIYGLIDDEDLRTQIADLRYKKRHQVILLHGSNVTVDFPKFANEHYNWDKFLEEVPNVHQVSCFSSHYLQY